MKKYLLLLAIASLSIITVSSAQAQQNDNATVDIIGKKYVAKLDFKDIWESLESEEDKKEEKEMTPEQKKKLDMFLDAIDCYMYITIKNAEKLVIKLKISMNKQKGQALGLNAAQRAMVGTLFKTAAGSDTEKYIRKGAFIYDASDPNDDEPIEIINGGKALKYKDSDFKKTYILKETK